MQLMQLRKGLVINASAITAIQVNDQDGHLVSDIHMKAGKVYTVHGDWSRVLRSLLKTGAIWTDGKTVEYRA